MTDEPKPSPEAPQPEPTQPEAATPEAPQPEAAAPEPTQPEAAQPETTQPEATAPDPAAPATPETPAPPSDSFTFTQPEPKKKSSVVNPYVWGTGRRKSSVARVRIRPGDGKFLINKKEVDDFFRLDKDRASVRTPLRVTDTAKFVDVFVNVGGGGTTGQAGAVLLGLARALSKADSSCEPKLREHNLLSRDARRVERKKYGQRGARRRFQFSKR